MNQSDSAKKIPLGKTDKSPLSLSVPDYKYQTFSHVFLALFHASDNLFPSLFFFPPWISHKNQNKKAPPISRHAIKTDTHDRRAYQVIKKKPRTRCMRRSSLLGSANKSDPLSMRAKRQNKKLNLEREVRSRFSLVEQAMGVEPTSKAWEAFILPMNYACISFLKLSYYSTAFSFRQEENEKNLTFPLSAAYNGTRFFYGV